MKIEVGKKYEMANGQVATIMEFRPGALFPFMGSFGAPENGGTTSWNADGEQVNSANEYRLVAEHVAPLAIFKLELGKRYMTRNGFVTEPLTAGTEALGDCNDQYHEFGAELEGCKVEGRLEWRGDGRFYHYGESETDLVSEYAGMPKSMPYPDWLMPCSDSSNAFTLPPGNSPGEIKREIPTDLEIIAALDQAMTGHSQLPRCQQSGIYSWFATRYAGIAP